MSRSLADRSPNNNGNGRSNGSGGCHCPPDQELVVLIKSATDGTEIEQVVALIYKESSPSVAFFVRKELSTASDEIIANIISDIWIGFIKGLNGEGFELKTTFEQYLIGIAKNKIRDHLKLKQKGVAPGSRRSTTPLFSGDEPLFEEDHDGVISRETLVTSKQSYQDPSLIIPILESYEQALRWLEEQYGDYYQVLILSIEEELTDRQIAARLSLTPSNVRVRKTRARQKLRDFLSDGS